jgi:hypothetical protein
MDVYFYASYEIVRDSNCRQRHKLTGSGGEENSYFNVKNYDSSCNDMAWLVEAKRLDHSLFIQTWGNILPLQPTPEELAKCQTKNRLIVYSGDSLSNVRVICPAIKSESHHESMQIFSEDWMKSSTMPTK